MAQIKKKDIQKLNELDIEKIELVKGGYNKNKIILQYDNKPLYIKLNNTHSPFGVSTYKDSKKYSIYVNIEDELKTFLNKLKVKTFSLINSDKALQKMLKMRKFNEDIFNNTFNSFYKEKEDSKYPPLFKLNFINNYDNREMLDCLLYDKDKKFNSKQQLPEELKNLLGKKTINKVCIQPFFYHVNKSIGITFKIKILQMISSETLSEKLEELVL